MSTNDKGKVYKEVLVVLESFDTINKIPQNIINNMKKLQDTSYEYKFDKDVAIEEQRISKEAATILSVLYIKYISNSNDEIQLLKEIYKKNDDMLNTRKFQEEPTRSGINELSAEKYNESDNNNQNEFEKNSNKVTAIRKRSTLEIVKDFLKKLLRI